MPIVEPEVLMDGGHDIDDCDEAGVIQHSTSDPRAKYGQGTCVESPVMAEGVEEVPRVRILETVIQEPGRY